jgi:hypothetical protein
MLLIKHAYMLLSNIRSKNNTWKKDKEEETRGDQS